MGNDGWEWENVKKYFRRSLDYSNDFFKEDEAMEVKEEYQQGGEWKVSKQKTVVGYTRRRCKECK